MAVIPGTQLSYGQAPEPEEGSSSEQESEPEPEARGPTVCPEVGMPVPHARRAYRCRCDVCRKPGERDPSEPDPEAEAEAERLQAEAEARSENIRKATFMTYDSGPSDGTIPKAALEDVQSHLEGDD